MLVLVLLLLLLLPRRRRSSRFRAQAAPLFLCWVNDIIACAAALLLSCISSSSSSSFFDPRSATLSTRLGRGGDLALASHGEGAWRRREAAVAGAGRGLGNRHREGANVCRPLSHRPRKNERESPPKKKSCRKKKKRLDVSRPSPHSFRSLKKSRVGELLPTRLFLLLLSTSPLSPNSVFLEHALIGRSARVACTSLASGGLSAGSPRKGESASPCFTTAASVFFLIAACGSRVSLWGSLSPVSQRACFLQLVSNDHSVPCGPRIEPRKSSKEPAPACPSFSRRGPVDGKRFQCPSLSFW